MRRFNRTAGVAAFAAVLAGLLGGCSNGYLDRRDTISRSAGDAIASNKVTQMVDPWPAYSVDTKIGFNGQKMQSAVERYRNNQVTPPNGTGTSATYQQAQQNNAGGNAANAGPVGPTVTQQVK